jgi:hypothetical protein
LIAVSTNEREGNLSIFDGDMSGETIGFGAEVMDSIGTMNRKGCGGCRVDEKLMRSLLGMGRETVRRRILWKDCN